MATAAADRGDEGEGEGGGPAMLRSLRNRDYRLFWIGLVLALTGWQVQRVALGYLAYEMTGSAFYLTLILTGDSIPMILLSPVVGVVADRVDRKRLILLTRSLNAVFALVVSALVFVGAIEPWHLLVFTMLTGVAFAFDLPARQAAIRDLVPEADLANAVALSSTALQATRIVGPAIGGVLLVAVGSAGALVCMAAGYFGMVLLLLLVHMPHVPRPHTRGTLGEFRQGLRFIARTEAIWTLMLVSALGALFAMTYQSLTPVFAQDVLGRGKGAIGVMFTAAGVGALAGSIGVAALGDRCVRPWLAAAATALFGLLVMAFAAAASYPVALAMLVLVGGVGAVGGVINTTAVQALTPPELQGRVMSVYQLTWTANFFGALAIGWLADRIGAPAAVMLAGALTAAMIALLMLFVRGSLRRGGALVGIACRPELPFVIMRR